MKRVIRAAEGDMRVPLRLTPEQMNNPDSLDLGRVNRDNVGREKQRIADEAEAKRKEELKEKYSNIFSISSQDKDPSEIIEDLFEELVPTSGQSETVAGELVRAANRLGYRWYNDGDKCYSGYGIETCGNAINYLCEFLDDDYNTSGNVEDAAAIDIDDKYEEFLYKLYRDVVDFINTHPDKVLEPAEDMYSKEYDDDKWLKELEPRTEEELSSNNIEYGLQDYLDEFEDIIEYDRDDAFEEMIQDLKEDWYGNGIEIDQWARDAATVRILDDDVDELWNWVKIWCEHKLEDLESEFGSYDDLYEKKYSEESDEDEDMEDEE